MLSKESNLATEPCSWTPSQFHLFDAKLCTVALHSWLCQRWAKWQIRRGPKSICGFGGHITEEVVQVAKELVEAAIPPVNMLGWALNWRDGSRQIVTHPASHDCSCNKKYPEKCWIFLGSKILQSSPLWSRLWCDCKIWGTELQLCCQIHPISHEGKDLNCSICSCPVMMILMAIGTSKKSGAQAMHGPWQIQARVCFWEEVGHQDVVEKSAQFVLRQAPVEGHILNQHVH